MNSEFNKSLKYNNLSFPEFNLTAQQALIIADWQRERDEARERLFGQVIVCANLLMILAVMCCVLVARWMSASGCMERRTTKQLTDAAKLRIFSFATDPISEANSETILQKCHQPQQPVSSSLKRMVSWPAEAAAKIRCDRESDR